MEYTQSPFYAMRISGIYKNDLDYQKLEEQALNKNYHLSIRPNTD